MIMCASFCASNTMTPSSAVPNNCEDGTSKIFLPSLVSFPHKSKTNLHETHGFSSSAHWVIPGILMQGSRPSKEIPSIVKKNNCRVFVCLQAECDPEDGASLISDGGCRVLPSSSAVTHSYSNEVSSAAKEAGGPPPIFLHYGIKGMQPAESVDGLENLVSHLANRIRSGEVIYIHCSGGVGRAGLVASCLLGELYESLDAEEALGYVNMLCQLRNPKIIYHSPETESQKEQVREFFNRSRQKLLQSKTK